MAQELIVDLHIHSHYSRATSPQCTFEELYRWGKIKGINIIGTGDCTHPEWFAEMREKLEPAEGDLLRLRHELAEPIDRQLPPTVRNQLIRFVPSVEIATIYRKGERVRKLHQLVVLPDLTAVSRLNSRLERVGNLKADGRPILGLDSKMLLQMVLDTDARSLYIPAHIWTPWFGLFGSKSGFDTLTEAFEELTPEVRAIETGLSSDPPMNWRLSQLKDVAITSHSDAHSPQRLGREATVLRAEPSYDELIGGIKDNDARLMGTIEFFPEEGKYHSDGHRICKVRSSPDQTKQHNGSCPICSKPLVVGVGNRVEQLADIPAQSTMPAKQVEYIVPLFEVIAELKGLRSIGSRTVVDEYHGVIGALGNEFAILRALPIDHIRERHALLALAVERIRGGQVYREPGFDGVYGTIRVFKDAAERADTLQQTSLL
ncbi:MAG TPA: endonuclease Q family protein [Candidatus Saccharimonadales bacterium]|nr:endonuclease Q family protein [Candidatus Saccharimonadales bacterium]